MWLCLKPGYPWPLTNTRLLLHDVERHREAMNTSTERSLILTSVPPAGQRWPLNGVPEHIRVVAMQILGASIMSIAFARRRMTARVYL